MFSKLVVCLLFLFGRSYGQSCSTDCIVDIGDENEGFATSCCDVALDGQFYDSCNCDQTTSTPNKVTTSTPRLVTTKMGNSSMDGCELDWAVDWVGKSGQFKLYPCSDSNFFIKVNLQTLQAYDNDGKKQATNKVTAFSYASSEDATYSYSGDGNNVYELTTDDGAPSDALGGVQLNYDFDVNGETVDFIMTLYLLDADYQLTTTDNNGNIENYTLEQGTLKFDFDIINWPFENDDDHLDLEIRITTGGDVGDAFSYDDTSFSWGKDDDGTGDVNASFTIYNPNVYSKTSDSGDVAVTYDVSSSGKHVDLTFRFECVGINNHIYYDPWFTGDTSIISDGGSDSITDGSSSNSSRTSIEWGWIIIICAIIVIFLFVGITFYLVKIRKNNDKQKGNDIVYQRMND